MLQFYNKLSTDACKNGLGAVLLQLHNGLWKPVAYASRSLSDAETRYAMIEKELLGIVFGCERFHQFIYGAAVVSETDHNLAVSSFRILHVIGTLLLLLLVLIIQAATAEQKMQSN